MSLKLNERYPGRFNNPSGSYPQGSFKNRTTPSAKDGSYLEQDWANDKEGFFQSILSAAGIEANGSADKVGASQVFDATRVLEQRQSGVYFPSTGTSSAQILTPTPALSAYAIGVRYSVAFNVSSGVNPTINVSARGAKSLKKYGASGSKVAAVWAAGQIGDIVFDGVDFVLLNPADSLSQATELALGVVKIATDVQMLDDANDTAVPTPKKFRKGFAISLAANGYIAFPTWLGGLVIQWGAVLGTAAGVDKGPYVFTFPIEFPNAALQAVATIDAVAINGNSYGCYVNNLTKNSVSVYGDASATSPTLPNLTPYRIIAIGY